MNKIDNMLVSLSEAPDSQVDKTITTRIGKLVGQPSLVIKIEMKRILEDCKRGSLASEFATNIMQVVFGQIQKEIESESETSLSQNNKHSN